MSYYASCIFPTIAGRRIPIQYYSLLYPYLDRIWSKAYSDLGDICGVERRNRDLFIRCNDHDLFVEALVILHTSFFTVNGYYNGEPVDRRRYAEFLINSYRPRLSRLFTMLASSIRSGDYGTAYNYALEAVHVISEAEVLYVEVGGSINQLYFEMLHGGIPVTYTNTWRLVEEGAEIVKNLAPQIYSSVGVEAERVARLLKAMVVRIEEDSIGDKQ